jgi:hypothetical protein
VLSDLNKIEQKTDAGQPDKQKSDLIPLPVTNAQKGSSAHQSAANEAYDPINLPALPQ